MDFQKVLEPYQEEGVKRDYAEYIKWLTGPKYGIAKEFAEKALLIVFTELEQGKTFSDDANFKAPHFLDQYIRDTAIKLRDEWATEESTKMETFFNNLLQTHKDKWQEALSNQQKPGVWKRVKAVFRPQ